ncbi:aldose 1-epimerase [Paenibacillus protaetiae]|uniref:Aldose 1-epimerase n=1 Tax=Paenibacillus protaetiae TaxID=2509456 RepID=A0A4P6F4G1_9BACL|nr:aldose 1-epimerase [Paenibacillus protaetiae]QAY68067.1 aldose 1-epimerase [Paenibacillus protaetiae]
MQGQAFEQPFYTEKAVWLKWGPYEAAVVPEIGANLIAFRDTVNGYAFLREPKADEIEQFKANTIVYGIPVLFPPNRYDDGKFTFQGREYTFPVNEPASGNHLHGFFHDTPWTVEDYGVTKTESYVSLKVTVDEQHAIYRYLPHRFTLRLRYSLNETGLLQHVSVHNEGNEDIPCMIGFHTTVNAPFAPGSTPEDCTFTLTIGERWELSDRSLPTGKKLPLLPEEERMKSGGITPYWGAMDNHYTAVPQNGRNAMELTDHRIGKTLVYDVSSAYKQWMIWNNNMSNQYFCPEPQLNLVNAPNSSLPAEETGFVTLEPGGIWESTSRLYVK